MGKILILTFSDSEEPIMDKILTAVEGEPTMEHIANRHTPSVLTFPNLEIRINEQIIYTITTPSLSPTMSSSHYLPGSTPVLGSLERADLRNSLESGPGALRGGGGECGVFP